MTDFKVLAVKVLPEYNDCIRKVLYEDRWHVFIRTMILHKTGNG